MHGRQGQLVVKQKKAKAAGSKDSSTDHVAGIRRHTYICVYFVAVVVAVAISRISLKIAKKINMGKSCLLP